MTFPLVIRQMKNTAAMSKIKPDMEVLNFEFVHLLVLRFFLKKKQKQIGI